MKISIVTPTYNQGKFIEETILSVISQKNIEYEYIIIDGGSEDNTLDVIKKYERHISYWVSESDNGQADAINKGLKVATGDYICWLNSDDLFMNNTLEIISKYVEIHPECKFIYGDGVMFWDGLEYERIYKVHPGYDAHRKIKYCDPILQPSTFWHREIYDEIGGVNESLHFTMDWEYFIRISEKYEFFYIPEILSKYRIHKDHKTSNGGSLRAGEIMQIIGMYSDSEWRSLYESVFSKRDNIKINKKLYGNKISKIIYLFNNIDNIIKYKKNILIPYNMI